MDPVSHPYMFGADVHFSGEMFFAQGGASPDFGMMVRVSS
jgi:hypothetical protein